jgi:hypothetical protein
MKRLAMVIVTIQLLLTGVAFCASGLKFTIPSDWIDLSPGAPEENFTKVPEFMVKDARDPKTVAFATFDAGPRGGRAVMHAQTEASRITITEESVKRLGEHMEATQTNMRDGGKFTLVTSGTILIDGVTCGKIVGDLTVDKDRAPITEVMYLVPDGARMVNILFTTSARFFKKLEPKFDEIAQAITGVGAPSVAADQGPLFPVRAAFALNESTALFETADESLPQAVSITNNPAPNRSVAAPALLSPR